MPNQTRKPTTTQRGYGWAHQAARKRWEYQLTQAGALPCARCRKPVTPFHEWELDHTDDRTTYLGISHKICNRRAGGKKAQRQQRTKRAKAKLQSWDW